MRCVVRMNGRYLRGLGAAALVLFAAVSTGAGQGSTIDPAYPPSYFEFGMVVGLGGQDIEVQTFDENRHKLVQHSFALTRETRADKVQVGDAVEVIYVPGSTVWTLRRLILLSSGIPMMGPPVPGYAAGSGARLPTQAGPAVRPAAKAVTLAPGSAAKGERAGARAVTLPAAAAPKRGSGGEVAVALGKATEPKVAEIKAAPLGGAPESVKAAEPKERAVVLATPSEECNRSAVDWPARPLSLAVLDFRYPTEREESHDLGRTGGGSGTAVADLVFARLERLPEFALSRGDRQKLYKADFAGAARVGRQLGVDAVLAGTFVPVEEPLGPDGFPVAPRAWELRAGLVDTCTGQLLMRLYSQTCAGGAEPGNGMGECKRYTVTAKEAADPVTQAGAFQVPLDALLYPLEHNVTRPGENSADVVTEVSEGGVTLRLSRRSVTKVGDVFAVHARRLAKNPATYTLQYLQDQEIGRVTVTSVRGGDAVGSFAGEIPPRVGDVVERVTQ